MSVRDWVLGPLFAAAFVWQVSEIVGPFELGDDAPADASRAQRVRLWLAGWPRRPRPALSFKDWMPPGGVMFLPTLISAGLVYGGVWVLFGPGETFRLGGALALLGGVPLGSLVVGYVRRPVGVPPCDASATGSPPRGPATGPARSTPSSRGCAP